MGEDAEIRAGEITFGLAFNILAAEMERIDPGNSALNLARRVLALHDSLVAECLATIPRWPCGHDRTPENTQRIGKAGVRCKICRKRIKQASLARRSVQRPTPARSMPSKER